MTTHFIMRRFFCSRVVQMFPLVCREVVISFDYTVVTKPQILLNYKI